MNLRFDPSGVAGEKGLEIIESVIREYVQHDGQHIQINVVDDKTLRAAQKNPENYRNILVRVAGYMAYFTELDKFCAGCHHCQNRASGFVMGN